MPPPGRSLGSLMQALIQTPPTAPQVALPQTLGPRPQPMTLGDMVKAAIFGGLAGMPSPYQDDRQYERSAAVGEAMGLGIPLMAAGVKGAKTLKQLATSAEEAPVVIKAYHGSPHDFDKFSLEKIGTGEGAQAYGHGLYFAENPGVAEEYRHQLASSYGNSLADSWVKAHGFNPDAALAEAKQRGVSKQLIEDLENYKRPGKTYEVAIKASPDEFLHWDKPLSEQPEKVKQALAKLDPDTYHPSGSDYDPNERGQQTYHRLWESSIKSGKAAPAIQKQQEVTEKLKGLGIKGVKYLDQGSRYTSSAELLGVERGPDGLWRSKLRTTDRANAFGQPGTVVTTSKPYKTEAEALKWAQDQQQSGSHNYVVFDDALIEIMKKFGVSLPVAHEMLQREQERAKP